MLVVVALPQPARQSAPAAGPDPLSIAHRGERLEALDDLRERDGAGGILVGFELWQ